MNQLKALQLAKVAMPVSWLLNTAMLSGATVAIMAENYTLASVLAAGVFLERTATLILTLPIVNSIADQATQIIEDPASLLENLPVEVQAMAQQMFDMFNLDASVEKKERV